MMVLYLCDGKKERCGQKCGCSFGKSEYGNCKHTAEPEHAINGPCPDPQNHPERFEAVVNKVNGAVMYYFEKEVIS